MMLENIAISSVVRTPIGKALRGSFNNTRPDDLCAAVIKEAAKRSHVPIDAIEDVIIGCAMPEAEQGMNVARIASLRAGLSERTSAATVNRFCSSGLHALADVAKSIATGQIKCGIAGGVESMSMVPMGGNKPSANPYLIEHLPKAYTSMGITAENVATTFGISRAEQDKFSLSSHKKALAAIESHAFKNEITSIETLDKGIITTDEGPRKDTSLEGLSSLRAVFKKDGSVTAGNSSQMSDGAAGGVLCHSNFAKQHRMPIEGFFRAFVTAGVGPEIMGIGPVFAVRKLLEVTGLSLNNIDVFELNEAFASQAVYCIKELGLDEDKVNPHGGAIALGHPLGCTGARQVATILNYMKAHSLRYGICTMCIGGGMGAAALIERA